MEQLLDKHTFEAWMEKIMSRLDEIDPKKSSEKSQSTRPVLDGVTLIDNTDVCQMLNITKRTLQRYRATGQLPFYLMYHKTYYKKFEVLEFMKLNFDENERRKRDRKTKKPTSR